MPSLTMSALEAREVLGLEPGFGRSELATAYRRLVRSVHPDLLVDAPDDEVRAAGDRLAEVNLANEVLQRSILLNGIEPGSEASSDSDTPYTPSAPTRTAPSGRRSAESRRRWFSVFPAR